MTVRGAQRNCWRSVKECVGVVKEGEGLVDE